MTVLSHEGEDAMSLFSPSVKQGKEAFFSSSFNCALLMIS